MKKPLAAAAAALVCLSLTACGGTDDDANAADGSENSPAAVAETNGQDSFAEFLQGNWRCDGKTPYVEADLRAPAVSRDYVEMKGVDMVITEDTFAITDGYDGEVFEGGWSMDGRTMTVTLPEGTQIIENVPETWEYALEPVDMTLVGGDNEDERLRVWVEGQRQFWMQSEGDDADYASLCVKS